MGGYRSGRRSWHSKADTVEDCRVLDINRWTQEGVLRPGVHSVGGWKWWDERTGEVHSRIGYAVDTRDLSFPSVRLLYTITRSEEHIDYRIPLATTHPHLGGIRWWFVCPLSVNGHTCTRRVGKLYLPPRGRYFGCRRCYRLTYESCQESHRYDRVFALLAKDFPGATPALMKRVLSQKR